MRSNTTPYDRPISSMSFVEQAKLGITKPLYAPYVVGPNDLHSNKPIIDFYLGVQLLPNGIESVSFSRNDLDNLGKEGFSNYFDNILYENEYGSLPLVRYVTKALSKKISHRVDRVEELKDSQLKKDRFELAVINSVRKMSGYTPANKNSNVLSSLLVRSKGLVSVAGLEVDDIMPAIRQVYRNALPLGAKNDLIVPMEVTSYPANLFTYNSEK